MNVLQISQSDAGGGAARVASNMQHAFREKGHGARMLVGVKTTNDAGTRSIKRHAGWRVLDRAFGDVANALSLQYVFYPSSFAVAADPWFRAADVVQLHN